MTDNKDNDHIEILWHVKQNKVPVLIPAEHYGSLAL